MKAAETERFSPISRFSLQRRAIKSALKLLISMAVPVCGQNGYLSHSGVKKGGGLGIGLYLMRQLITEAGDTLQAFTPTQEPMIFVISLPRSL